MKFLEIKMMTKNKSSKSKMKVKKVKMRNQIKIQMKEKKKKAKKKKKMQMRKCKIICQNIQKKKLEYYNGFKKIIKNGLIQNFHLIIEPYIKTQ